MLVLFRSRRESRIGGRHHPPTSTAVITMVFVVSLLLLLMLLMMVLVDMITRRFLPLGHVFGLVVRVGGVGVVGDSPDRLLELLDVLQFVVCLATLSIFLLEFVLLEVVLLRHPLNIRIRILALAPTLLFRLLLHLLLLLLILIAIVIIMLIAIISLLLLLLLLLLLIPALSLLIRRAAFLRLLPAGGGRRLNCLFGGGGRGAFLGRGCICRRCGEDIVAHVDLFRQASWQVLATVNFALLLPGFALFVLFLLIGCILTIVICHVYLISELDSETAALDPGSLGLQRDGTWRQAVEDVVVDAGDHVWRLDEGKAERGSQVDSCRTVDQ